MKRFVFSLFAVALILVSCGQSEEEKAMTKVVYGEYKEGQIKADTEVPFNILNLKVKDKQKDGGRTFYDVSFTIQEIHPDRRYYYDGTALIERNTISYKVVYMNYTENKKYNK